MVKAEDDMESNMPSLETQASMLDAGLSAVAAEVTLKHVAGIPAITVGAIS